MHHAATSEITAMKWIARDTWSVTCPRFRSFKDMWKSHGTSPAAFWRSSSEFIFGRRSSLTWSLTRIAGRISDEFLESTASAQAPPKSYRTINKPPWCLIGMGTIGRNSSPAHQLNLRWPFPATSLKTMIDQECENMWKKCKCISTMHF